MFQRILLANVGSFGTFRWNGLGSLNVVIGENDTGKSYLLKMLYSVARSAEEFRKAREGERTAWTEVLANKLRWTYQPPDFKLGKLVRKGHDRLKVDATLCNHPLHFAFGRSTTKEIRDARLPGVLDDINALFFPPKEVLTAIDAIAATRDELQMAGFGDTYLDLIKALRIKGIPETQNDALGDVKDELERLFDGEVRYESGEFLFRRGNEQYNMSQTAEGIKKIGILTQLIENGRIGPGSVLFFDEPEANMHPKASVQLVNMLHRLTSVGIQVFIATHDYFIIKQLELIARRYDEAVQLCSMTRERGELEADFSDLREGMPDNPIIDVSLELLQEDMDLGMEE